jgi:hypothetical protein
LDLLGLSSSVNRSAGLMPTGVLGKLGQLLSQKPAMESSTAMQALLAKQAGMPKASFLETHENQPLWFYQ